MMKSFSRSCLLFLCVIAFSCRDLATDDSPFTVLDHTKTGLEFSNVLTPTPAFNLFSYMYFYNGSGVGAGDLNNDGLIDLFFASSQKRNRLYINRGDLRFEDVTDATDIPMDSSWSTGVSIVDINADGMLDIYICQVGQFKMLKAKNQLLVCKGIDKNGIPSYAEEAEAYGLDFSGFSTHAAFLDHDGDGDLDMFLLNHSVNHDGNYRPRNFFSGTYDSLAGQRFYKNEAIRDASGKSHIRFRDITRESGINGSRIGYGLGVAISDINLDGRPDIYVGNDFHENDYLYINTGEGTFREEGSPQLRHTSQFSMGVDAADINNDAFPDIVSMDMLPYDPTLLRRSLSEDDYAIYQQKIAYGYSHQYARNNLQLNNGDGSFSEVGQYAGIHATDWSWASLLMDFNNDGKKDLFVSNGIPKRMNDIDYINFVSGAEMQDKLRQNKLLERDLAMIDRFPEIKIPNQFFVNRGALRFDNISDSVAGNPKTFSNGSVYADLDNDGDLDIVVNNINAPALVYRNNTAREGSSTSFASIDLKGPPGNPSAVGAKIILYVRDETMVYERQAVHGFQSSMHIPIHIGLEGFRPDSAIVVWPDNSFQPINVLATPRQIISFRESLPHFDHQSLRNRKNDITVKGFQDITARSGLLYLHQENRFNEFDREPLLPQMISTEGPAIAVADINHDGLEDVFVGASKTFHNATFLQHAGGGFKELPQPELLLDSMWENVDALWVDVNQDKHPDLVLASGGNEYYNDDVHLKPLLYLNDGSGRLASKKDAFGDVYDTQSRVISTDFNGDGYPDLFIAGRVVPWQYGKAPRSYLLQNDGTGKFTDVTAVWSKELLAPGMVTDAQWMDLDGDRKDDLVICYNWGGIDAFMRKGGSFVRQRITTLKGWWQKMLITDLDNDGDSDIIAGNFGLNSRLKASKEAPVRMYVNDFDDNGRIEQIISYHVGGMEIPFASKILLEKSLPAMKKKFLYAEDFSKADMTDLFGGSKLGQAMLQTANTFESMIFINEGNLLFTAKPLPLEAQLGTVRSLDILPSDGSSLPDIMIWGNFHANNVENGRQDALRGMLLLNRGDGVFRSAPIRGVDLKGQVPHVKSIHVAGMRAFVVTQNNDSLKLIIRDPR